MGRRPGKSALLLSLVGRAGSVRLVRRVVFRAIFLFIEPVLSIGLLGPVSALLLLGSTSSSRLEKLWTESGQEFNVRKTHRTASASCIPRLLRIDLGRFVLPSLGRVRADSLDNLPDVIKGLCQGQEPEWQQDGGARWSCTQ
jgi:hypothetical protein